MTRQAITLEALEVLDAIDSKGSFAAAANQLYKTPSSITYSVQKLEQALRVTLFVKQGRKSVLTPAGKVLLDQGREILAATENLAETTREVDRGWESKLNIAIDTSLGTEHIYSHLEAFFSLKPEVEINLYEEALGGGWEALSENRVDLAIGLPDKPSEISGFCCEPYSSSHWVFAVHHSHPLANIKQALSKKDIEGHRAVVIRDSSSKQAKLSRRLFSKQAVLSVQTLKDKISAQKAGLGVGYLPKTSIAKELSSGEMIQLAIEDVEQNSLHYLVWRRGQKGKALRWFIDRLKAQ